MASTLITPARRQHKIFIGVPYYDPLNSTWQYEARLLASEMRHHHTKTNSYEPCCILFRKPKQLFVLFHSRSFYRNNSLFCFTERHIIRTHDAPLISILRSDSNHITPGTYRSGIAPEARTHDDNDNAGVGAGGGGYYFGVLGL